SHRGEVFRCRRQADPAKKRLCRAPERLRRRGKSDIDGRPTLHSSGCAQVTFTFDTRGNWTEETCSGLNGEPVRNVNGYAREVRVYDARDKVSEFSYFGPVGELALNKS